MCANQLSDLFRAPEKGIMLKHRDQDKLSRVEGLRLWHRVNLANVLADHADLTTRQMAILTIIYLEDGPHTVRSLAKRINVTKAVITRAIRTLGGYGFVERGTDLRDKRSVLLIRTGRGSRYLSDFAERVRLEARNLDISQEPCLPKKVA